MFDAQVFVDNVRNGIGDDRRKAGWCKLAGYVVILVGLAVLWTGVIESFALASPEFRSDRIVGGFSAIAASVWNWMDAIMPPVWWFLRLISPYPSLTLPLTPLSLLLSCAGLLGWSFGLMWLGIKLLLRSAFLSERASEEEKFLKNQTPILLQMQSIRNGQDIDISGDRNVVNAVNTITNIREERNGWWNGPTSLIVIGVAINIVSRFLHLS